MEEPGPTYGRYKTQYVWRCPTARCHREVFLAVRPALDAIDWALPAQRISDRDQPLADKTMRRIPGRLRGVRKADIPTVTPVDRHALLPGGTVASVEDLGSRRLFARSDSSIVCARLDPPAGRSGGAARPRPPGAGGAVARARLRGWTARTAHRHTATGGAGATGLCMKEPAAYAGTHSVLLPGTALRQPSRWIRGIGSRAGRREVSLRLKSASTGGPPKCLCPCHAR